MENIEKKKTLILFHPSQYLSSQLTALELHYVSPKLLMCHDLELAVPGTYDPNKPIVRIAKVESALQVCNFR